MRAFITGDQGFIGRHFRAELTRRGWDVRGCDVLKYNTDAMHDFRGDWDAWNEGPYDLVVHAAARSPHREAIDKEPASHVYNRMLDAAMFDWAIRTGQRHVLYFSSCAALDEKPDAYGLAKLAGEAMAQHARDAGTPVTVVRPFSGYGEDQDERFPFGAFIARAKRRDDPFVIWGDGTQVRDWIHVDDVVKGALALVEAGVTEPTSLCTGEGTSMRELVELVCRSAGYSPEIELRADKPAGTSYRVGDPTALRRHYQPTVTLEQGVKRAL